MSASVVTVVALLVTAVLVGGCGSAPPVTPSPPPTAAPTLEITPLTSTSPTGASTSPASPLATPFATPALSPSATPFVAEREYVSDDGQLKMLVPDGAVPDTVTLSAFARGQRELPLELTGVEVRNAFYEVGPSDVGFLSPVRMERSARLKDLDIDLAAEGLPLLVPAMRSPDAAWSWLDSAEMSVEDRSLIVRGDAASVGLLFAFGGRDFTTLEWSMPDRVVPVGSTFTLTVSLAAPDEGGSPPLLGAMAPVVAPGVIESSSATESDGRAAVQEFRCVAAGEVPVGVSYSVSNLFADSVLFGQLGLGPASTNVTATQTVTCSEDATSLPTNGPDGPDDTPEATAPSL